MEETTRKDQRITLDSIFVAQARICQQILDGEEVGKKIQAFMIQIVCASGLYGFTMGIRHSFAQAISSTIKLPMLFCATLFICLPALHFLGLLMGSPMKFTRRLGILLLGIANTSVLLGSFAPVSLFFLMTGSRYPFIMLLHVGILAFCGAVGVHSINKNMTYASLKCDSTIRTKALLRTWSVVYMFVGTQMAYVLSPFVSREGGFQLFTDSGGNFYTYLFSLIREALTSGL